MKLNKRKRHVVTKKVISVSLDKEVADRIDTLSGATMIPASSIVNYVLKNSENVFEFLEGHYLEDEEQKEEEQPKQ